MPTFECHITIEPVAEDRLAEVEALAKEVNFKPAKLLMQNRATGTPERSMYDTFLTGHSDSYPRLTERMVSLCIRLKESGFQVWRYKVEEIMLDSRIADHYSLLSTISLPPPKAPQ